ncbi:MAG: hypothetical protein GTO41_22280, partial [Burkholderiales bacterium]|nr:hypothetical protein [Burkholderiales bacterium]
MKSAKNRSILPGGLISLIFLSLPAAAVTPVEVQKLLADDGEKEDYFGYSVAIDGDTAIIGSPGAGDGDLSNAGAAYAFARDGDTWSLQAKLLASDRAIHEVFGSAVAIDGNIAIIGAYGEDDSGLNGNGAAYVFTRSGEEWSETAKLMASDKASVDYFGWSVAIDGDVAVIGSLHADDSGLNGNGAAYVFTRSGESWSETAKLMASDKAS